MRAPSPEAPVDVLEPWIASRLLPVDAPDPGEGGGSDWELNANMPRPSGALARAAVLVPLVERPEGLTVLLTRRADTLTRHTGQVAFPGGRADPGETAVETALREAEEEIGLNRAHVRVVGRSDVYETVTGFQVVPVVAFVRPPFALSLRAAEVAEVFEPPFAWLMDAANHQLREADAPDRSRRRFYVMPWEGRFIWGATAGMIRRLATRVFPSE